MSQSPAGGGPAVSWPDGRAGGADVRTSGPLAGRAGIVTGGGKGLGRAFALSLSSAGAAVVVNNRNREIDAAGLGPADHVVKEIRDAGGTAVADHGDVADPGSVDAVIGTALEHYGRVDFLVTSAAVSNPEMFHKTSPARFDAVTAINIGGTAHLAAACSALMRQAGFGRIVLIASTAGLHGEPTAGAYSASKGAVIALGRCIAVEGARRDVLTNVVLPYATTQMTDAGMDPHHRDLMTAESVAPVVTALVDPTSTVNGQVLVCGGGAMRAAAAVEFGMVAVPPGLTGAGLAALVRESRDAPGRAFETAQAAFGDFAAIVTETLADRCDRSGCDR
ncbi:SDR family NAD(P)-dependent oxidoreductase [Nakamurella sp. PAMC28650]|uniref:SDR family NAD(P)-dependent oxidoreductase n=1 Tax=Nakamurella sp. PAMC28650 TaxID=2762325 RepID=UPI001C9AFC27|nr:SDR family NAD(P)-dependent oxidoreductase [Nakamurella sp. PAMC28650]